MGRENVVGELHHLADQYEREKVILEKIARQMDERAVIKAKTSSSISDLDACERLLSETDIQLGPDERKNPDTYRIAAEEAEKRARWLRDVADKIKDNRETEKQLQKVLDFVENAPPTL